MILSLPLTANDWFSDNKSAMVLVKFILEPASDPQVILALQMKDFSAIKHIYYLTRTFAFGMHREKQKLESLAISNH